MSENAPVKAPSFRDHRKAMLEDVATFISAQVMSQHLGIKLENVSFHKLGRAKHARASTRKSCKNALAGGGMGGMDF
jgi:chaperonin GroEL (HSP60 family)